MKQALIDLRDAIMSDHSIRRYTLTWKDVVDAIESKYNGVETKQGYFDDAVVSKAAAVATGKLKMTIETFARELSINLETVRSK